MPSAARAVTISHRPRETLNDIISMTIPFCPFLGTKMFPENIYGVLNPSLGTGAGGRDPALSRFPDHLMPRVRRRSSDPRAARPEQSKARPSGSPPWSLPPGSERTPVSRAKRPTRPKRARYDHSSATRQAPGFPPCPRSHRKPEIYGVLNRYISKGPGVQRSSYRSRVLARRSGGRIGEDRNPSILVG
jgi:hypothetical protein